MSTPPDLPAVAAAVMAKAISRLGLREVAVLRYSGKTLMAAATLNGRPVVIKMLIDDSGFWRARWQHELAVYRAFSRQSPPACVPAMIRTDAEQILVLEHLNGRPLDTSRYPARELDLAKAAPCLAAVRALSMWRPTDGLFAPVWDYPDRVTQYHAAGYLTGSDADALRTLLAGCGQPHTFAHGDPLPSNLLLTPDGSCALIDWEFGGLFLPGIDLAMLHTLLGAATPSVSAMIDQDVSDTGIEGPFVVNLAMVITRELRIHRELPASPDRDQQLAYLGKAWVRARERIHAAARDWTP